MEISRVSVKRWLKLALAFIGFLVISVALGYLVRYFLNRYNIPPTVHLWLAMIIIFGLLLAVNLSILPLPFGVSIMLAAATQWNPALIALAGSLGASLGEFSGYFFGYLGKKISIDENTPGYKLIHNWILRYGMWAIALLSFQPILPFEVGSFHRGGC